MDETGLDAEQARTLNRLLEKSEESFILAIELFNRPTIRYRVEGCAFFLCNAWELMLKARQIKRDGYTSIFYPGKTNRTLSLEDCIKRTMTNDKDPVRLNIESVNELRNVGTHFVVEEYEITYGPIFQANIRNFDTKLRDYHNREICDKIPENYLILSVNRTDLNGQTIRAKYTPDVVERLLSAQATVDDRAEESGNLKYAMYFHTDLVLSKKEGMPIRVDSSADSKARIVKELIDPTNKYPLRVCDILAIVNRQLKRSGTHLTYRDDPDVRFNQYHFLLFARCYNMKDDDRYAYDRSSRNERSKGQHSYVYSSSAADFIVNEIMNDPEHIIEKIQRKIVRMNREK